MQPHVMLSLGLSSLAESEASYPEEWGPEFPEICRRSAREFAEMLFRHLCDGGARPMDEAGTHKLLHEFGFDPTPTLYMT